MKWCSDHPSPSFPTADPEARQELQPLSLGALRYVIHIVHLPHLGAQLPQWGGQPQGGASWQGGHGTSRLTEYISYVFRT